MSDIDIDIDIDELAARIDELVVVDVRTPEEYGGSFGAPCDPRQGHIPGALNFNVEEMRQLPAAEVLGRLDLPEGAEVVAYCHSGSRSGIAVEILRRMGLPARNYVGSWHEWSRSELPLERDPASEPG